MPFSYRYFNCPDMPIMGLSEEIRSTAQLGLPWGDDEPFSLIRYLGLSEHSDFHRYECIHQVDREVDAVYNHNEIRRLLFNERSQLITTAIKAIFFIQAGKKESRDFFIRMSAASPPIIAERGKLDLGLVQSLGHTTGGWFAQLKIENVSTAGIFGTTDIVDSDEWSRYSDVGEISALNMRAASRAGIERSVMVTRDRLVLVMQGQDERDNLDFVAHLNEMFEGC